MTDDTIPNEDGSLFIALLYIQDELRRSGMRMTQKELKKTIKTAKKEMETRAFNDKDTQQIKKCLERTLNEKQAKITNVLHSFDWDTYDESNDNHFHEDNYDYDTFYDAECD